MLPRPRPPRGQTKPRAAERSSCRRSWGAGAHELPAVAPWESPQGSPAFSASGPAEPRASLLALDQHSLARFGKASRMLWRVPHKPPGRVLFRLNLLCKQF